MILAQIFSQNVVLWINLIATLAISILTVGMQYLFRSQLIDYKKEADKEVEVRKKQLEEKFAETIANKIENGKNLATKDHIEELTNKVETIKSEYASTLELLLLKQSSWYDVEKKVVFEFVDICIEFTTEHSSSIPNNDNISEGYNCNSRMKAQSLKVKAYVRQKSIYESCKDLQKMCYEFVNRRYSIKTQMDTGLIKETEVVDVLKNEAKAFYDEFQPKFDRFTSKHQNYFKDWTLDGQIE
jgi:hypothetical protein